MSNPSCFGSEKIEKAHSLIQQARNILIVTHKSPDGDAIGSSLAMKHYLSAKGKQARVMVPDLFPDFLKWMPGAGEIAVFDQDIPSNQRLISEIDLLILLDFNTINRTGDLAEHLPIERVPVVLIDHHRLPGDFPTVLFSDPEYCSTAQMIYDFVLASCDEALITVSMAECLYCGLMTDTGSFRFPSVTAETHRMAAALLDTGLDHYKIHRAVYDTNMPERLQMLGYALSEKLEVMPEYHAAVISMSLAELVRFNHRPGDTEGLVNYGLSIDGVRFSAFFREGNNEVRCSFRSAGSFDCNQFARAHFNGGGHVNAAGGNFSLPVENAVAHFKEVLPQYISQLKAND
jgi:bifunctional oligoribonuclease and PAP phosphatase NrnA